MCAIMAVASGKRGVMIHSNGSGVPRRTNPSSLSPKGRNPDKTYATSPLLTVSKVFGMTEFPASSLTAEISAAHSIVAMLMKSPLFAMYRPGQSLRYTLNWFKCWRGKMTVIP